jgi:hypothetical protein
MKEHAIARTDANKKYASAVVLCSKYTTESSSLSKLKGHLFSNNSNKSELVHHVILTYSTSISIKEKLGGGQTKSF